MVRSLVGVSSILVMVSGCLPSQENLEVVAANPFGNPPTVAVPVRVSYAPASVEASLRVDRVVRQVLAANNDIGLRPRFATDGAPQVEVTYPDRNDVHLTEGLVKRCATDGQLAAVICMELGKLVAEREALASPGRNTWTSPPLEVPIGNASQFNAPDQTHLVELARYEQERKARKRIALDPRALARQYLERAGFAATELDAATAALRPAKDTPSR
jgi:hypothetical protein